MQINRLFEIVYILTAKKEDGENITAKELAAYFEVSQRTVYRDIETLNNAGIPIISNKGKGGGVKLLDDVLLGFNKISVDFSDWSAAGKEKFNTIKTAITEKKCLAFDYFNMNGEKTHRIVYPMQLWFKYRAWYIKAFCLIRREYRLFKISRMKKVMLSENNFEIADLTALLPHDDNSEMRGITANQSTAAHNKSIEVKLLINASLAHRIYDEFDEENVEPCGDGNFIVKTTFTDDSWLYGYILSFGAGLEVLEPPYFRDKIAGLLREMLGRYLPL